MTTQNLTYQDALAETLERMAAKREIFSKQYPSFSRDAVNKWLYLESHGYYIVSHAENSFIFSSKWGNNYHMNKNGEVVKLKDPSKEV